MTKYPENLAIAAMTEREITFLKATSITEVTIKRVGYWDRAYASK